MNPLPPHAHDDDESDETQDERGGGVMDEIIPVKALWLTQREADYVMDSFRASVPLTRGLALKAAGLVLEFAAEDAVRKARDALATPGEAR